MARPLSLFMPVKAGVTLKDLESLGKYGQMLFDALKEVGTVHYARALLLDANMPNLQPGINLKPRWVIGILTEFDGSFEDYIHDFVTKVGEVFDALLKLVDGGEKITPVADHEAEFAKFLAKYDASQHLPNGALFQAYPYDVQKILTDCQ